MRGLGAPVVLMAAAIGTGACGDDGSGGSGATGTTTGTTTTTSTGMGGMGQGGMGQGGMGQGGMGQGGGGGADCTDGGPNYGMTCDPANSNCGCGVCFGFMMGNNPLCTIPCTTPADCPAPATQCNGMGVCGGFP